MGDRLLNEQARFQRAGEVLVDMEIAGPQLYQGAVDRALRTYKAFYDVSSVKLTIKSDAGTDTYELN
ncbi:hypothetical protein [Mycobacterium deserti]|uniref:Uncharacterized protein n=1 Tax=Mycobacterium deserti TaxID=2978347 RepID=A0ABT2MFK9_9MYCO|nr:hypothetical protein [Mycobacterium deserti]MCT7661012.1 hypothetical protein [Mycobacterium deserti]